jgi:hypothetical protein
MIAQVPPFDCCVIAESAIETLRLQSPAQTAFAVVFMRFYMTQFDGRRYVYRGDA